MNLTDREILELNELCGAVVDGAATEAQRVRLAELLRESEAARRFYVRVLGQSASLHGYAAEMHADAPELPVRLRNTFRLAWWSTLLPLAAAAVVAVLWWVVRHPLADGTAMKPEPVARLTAAKAIAWPRGAEPIAPGAHLGRGQRLELAAGYAEITFDSGARVVLEGGAALDINSPWDATLRRGTLKASVPAEAIGFRVSTAAVDVIDLGTEFTLVADASGAAEVLVHKGEVEAAPRATAGPATVLLRENDARRFAESGVTTVADREGKFARFAQPLALERFSAAMSYVHWSFDEPAGDVAAAERVGGAPAAGDAELRIVQIEHAPVERIEGRQGGALRFDGRTQARANLPGISGSAPRTIAFWVRVPEDAQLSDAYAMVAWATQLPKLGARPVHLSWNRRPAEGAIGALRTDFGGGHAMGTTSLRDGRWHHVAVCFAAGDDPQVPVQVKQYVDGRLESSAIVPGVLSAKPGAGDAAVPDVLWLGCRLSGQKERDRFRGELDELFVVDRGLEPDEIVALMKTNRPIPALAVR